MTLIELVSQCPLAYSLCMSYPCYASDLPDEYDWKEMSDYYGRRKVEEYIDAFWHFLERQRIQITTYKKEHWNEEESIFYYTCRYSISYIDDEDNYVELPYSDKKDYLTIDECNNRSLAQAFRFLEMRLYLDVDYAE